MNCNIIAVSKYLFPALNNGNTSWKIECVLYWKERITSDYFHSKADCCIRNKHSDRSESDNSKLLALYFPSGEFGFGFLHSLANILVILVLINPAVGCDNISWCCNHCRNNKFLNAVSIGTRCIKYYDTLFGTFIKWDVINTGTCSCHSEKAVRQCHIMHSRTSYENYVCLVKILRLGVITCKTR